MDRNAHSNLKVRVKYRLIETLNYRSSEKAIQSDKARMVIFGQGRSGSTLLESLVCSTGYFHKNGELLNVDRGEIRDPARYLRGLSKRKADENLVFHFKIYQLTRDRKRPIDPSGFLNGLYKDGWKIIYLLRRNKVRHALSNIVAESSDTYHKFDDKKANLSLRIDCNDLVKKVAERFEFEEGERGVLRGLPYHEVIYEDDLENSDAHQATINRILDFVSLKHRNVETKLRKANTQPLDALIANYDEFLECLREHGWEHFV
ncbi:MAG: hypothetical protein AAGI37_02875 [Planctomycetota bacterium]